MVKSFCKKEEFQPITILGEGVTLIKFSKETVYEPVYEGEGEERVPTGEVVDSGLVKYSEEMVYGELTADVVKELRLQELVQRDSSTEVNEFFYLGKSMWYDKVTRATISYSMECEKKSGAETTGLYDNDDVKYTLPIDLAISMFGQLEIYAKKCYNQTAFHHNALMALDNVDDLLAYDITTGYPEKLNIEAPSE